MDSAQITIVGHVEESPDIVHVVFTMRLAMGRSRYPSQIL